MFTFQKQDLLKLIVWNYRNRFGTQIYVFLSDSEIVKSAFSRPEFDGRPKLHSYGVFYNFENVGKDLFTQFSVVD